MEMNSSIVAHFQDLYKRVWFLEYFIQKGEKGGYFWERGNATAFHPRQASVTSRSLFFALINGRR